MGLSAWAKSQDTRSSDAKESLKKQPASVHGRALVFDVGDKKAYKAKHSNTVINHAIDRAPITRVPLHGLKGIQHSVRQATVEKYIDNPVVKPGTRHLGHGGLVDFPIVIQQDGERYIHDGHHRLTAQALLGETMAEVRFVNFDQEVP
jgi:hypothetical protein